MVTVEGVNRRKVAVKPTESYRRRLSVFGIDREGRVVSGGGVASKDAGTKPTRTYSRRPPPDTTRPGSAEYEFLRPLSTGMAIFGRAQGFRT